MSVDNGPMSSPNLVQFGPRISENYSPKIAALKLDEENVLNRQ